MFKTKYKHTPIRRIPAKINCSSQRIITDYIRSIYFSLNKNGLAILLRLLNVEMVLVSTRAVAVVPKNSQFVTFACIASFKTLSNGSPTYQESVPIKYLHAENFSGLWLPSVSGKDQKTV